MAIVAAEQAPDGWKIMEDVYRAGHESRSHDEGRTFRCSINAGGRARRKEFTFFAALARRGVSKTLVVFTSPKEIHGVALLSINQGGVADRQYIYTPATQRVRSVIPQERSVRFIGTDFTFEDIGERVLDDFNYKLLGDTEVIDGHKSYKVESTPVDQSRSANINSFITGWRRMSR